jgi:hypothetical protein
MKYGNEESGFSQFYLWKEWKKIDTVNARIIYP